ncbi:MAG: NADH-quinone oxidoreductase subunit N [Acidimicrobiia bacterium]|nr:NADH-quinone oxidoreductase subunit N [Acidimicrobiia bacterium]
MIAAAPVERIATPAIDWIAMAPELALVGAAAVIVMLKATLRRRRLYTPSLVVAGVGLAVAGAFLGVQWNRVDDHGPYQAIAGMVAVDGFAVFLGAVVLIATFLALLMSVRYVPTVRLDGPEYVALLLFSATGMLTMASANDLIVVFLSLEILSLPLYMLSAFDRRRDRSLEAGLKYFLLGAFSSAIFLYGIALVYGATGSTGLVDIAGFLASTTLLHEGTFLVGMVLILVGLGFKIAAVPFHTWTPDVYEGAPTPITAFMASATKAAGFAGLLRVLFTAFSSYHVEWQPVIFALAALSLVLGAGAAIVQRDVKRMLAYSSITHAGYVLIGLQAATERGLSASLFYLLVYTFMVVGSFAVVSLVTAPGDDDHGLDRYRGLAARQPVLAGVFAFLLFAQAGVPFTGGFVAKLAVFSAAADAHSYAMLLVGVLAAAAAAYFYLRVVVLMFMTEPGEESPRSRLHVDAASSFVLVATVGVTLFVGFAPGSFLHFAREATLLF